MTAFAETPWLLVFMFLTPALLIVFLRPPLLPMHSLLPPPSPASRTASPGPTRPNSRINIHDNHSNGSFPQLFTALPNEENATMSLLTGPVPYLTTYRAHMMLMTVLAILAVDFRVFPRSLAKCESFGVSLMDLGVGSFVFSQGLVSAIPILKDVSVLEERSLPKIFQAMKKAFPLLVLGLTRVILVKGVDYPEHVSEYGVHWNFFLTMALLPSLSVLLHPIILQTPIALVGLSISVVHEVMLQRTSLEAWVLSPHRHSLLSQNKEGITSLIGYLALHVLGLSMGTLLLPASPSLFKRQLKLLKNRSNNRTRTHLTAAKRQPGKTAIELCSYAFTWWILYGLSTLLRRHHKNAVSRRLANLPYVLWVAAFNTTFLLGYLLIDTYFFHVKPPPSFPYAGTSQTFDLDRSSVVPVPTNSRVAQDAGEPYTMDGHTSDGAITWSATLSPTFPLTRRVALHHPQSEDVTSQVSEIYYEGEIETWRRGPQLLEAINRNGLVVFLVANVLTGVVNLSMHTMYASNTVALGILILHSFVACGFAWVCRHRRLWRL